MQIKPCPIELFIQKLSSASITPAGGAASALSGAMGAGLLIMTANMTLGREKYRHCFQLMEKIIEEATKTKDSMLSLAQREVNLFKRFETVTKLPPTAWPDDSKRTVFIQKIWNAAEKLSFEILCKAQSILSVAEQMPGHFNINASGDFLAGIHHLNTAIQTSWLNLRLNTKNFDDTKNARNLSSAKNIFMKSQKSFNLIQSAFFSEV